MVYQSHWLQPDYHRWTFLLLLLLAIPIVNTSSNSSITSSLSSSSSSFLFFFLCIKYKALGEWVVRKSVLRGEGVLGSSDGGGGGVDRDRMLLLLLMCDRSASLRHRPHCCGSCWWCGGRRKREGGRDARHSGHECRFHCGLEASVLILWCSSVFFVFGGQFTHPKKKHSANWTIAFLGEKKTKKKLQKSPYFEGKKVTCRRHI
jgi:hypothetical protein